jgi:hypothetical protein
MSVSAGSAELVDKFNRSVKTLAIDMVKHFPQDAQVYRIKERITLSSNVTPMFIIETMGPYLLKYREQICRGDHDFFISNSYDADLRDAVDEEKADMVNYLMPKLKDAFVGKSDDEKVSYMEAVQDMLDYYLDLILIRKEASASKTPTAGKSPTAAKAAQAAQAAPAKAAQTAPVNAAQSAPAAAARPAPAEMATGREIGGARPVTASPATALAANRPAVGGAAMPPPRSSAR